MAEPVTTRRVIVTPRPRIEAVDTQVHAPALRVTTPLYDIVLELDNIDGDAGVVATAGLLIRELETLRKSAMARMAATHTGLPALHDALEPATMADALAGWTEAEKRAAWGNR
jgi:hypothetical protein